ncbi:NAD kinase [invertebrate metagenome]|uniref:NAD kinase n=1 Tax=invertebrate metagenome TaxID=1711999 RepID=A0A484H6G7_9ZZZZ
MLVGKKLAFVAGDSPLAQDALQRLQRRYEHVPPEQADIIVALGGDGFMLETLHRHLYRHVPIYGMNRGTIGFLMNHFHEDNLSVCLERAEQVQLHPLRMAARCINGEAVEALAINEVSLLRETRQAAKIRVLIDSRIRLEALICDGVLVCTPAGSTAYNLSAHGSILPLGANLLGLTPISAFRPRRWLGALLPHAVSIDFEIREPLKRPVSAVADYTEVRQVTAVHVHEDRSIVMTLLFDPEHNLEERILMEQFPS